MVESTVRGIRGATTAKVNTKEEIFKVTKELLHEILRENDIDMEKIAAAIFSVTSDLNATYPASAAREMGWNKVPLFGCIESNVPEGPSFCIRVLLLVNTSFRQDEIEHVYLNGAKNLRLDLAREESE